MTGEPFHVAQANCSVSTRAPCAASTSPRCRPGRRSTSPASRGRRSTSPSTSGWGRRPSASTGPVLIDDRERRATYLGDGFGHAFLALEDSTVVSYLCSAVYAPARDHGIDPLDPAIGIEWPTIGRDGATLTRRLSPKDAAAPTLAETRELGVLPTYERPA